MSHFNWPLCVCVCKIALSSNAQITNLTTKLKLDDTEMFNFSFVPMMQQSMPFPRIEGANQNNVLSLSDLLT